MENRYRQRIIDRLDSQRAKGVAKYGGTLEDNKGDILERLEHLAQELTDGLEYIEWIKELVGGQAQQKEPPKMICVHKTQPCYNMECFGNKEYRLECKNNYFCHYRPQEPIK